VPIELVDQQFSGEFRRIDIMVDTHNPLQNTRI